MEKSFFGGDPAIALKNLSADAIKSVEVVDEKSESARVTGVNDTERNKVINLTLKDDKKVNDFGKVQAGYGTDDRYLTSLNYNRFTSKIQASVIGKFNNVNTSGSDISEIITFNTGGGGGFGRFGGNNNSSSGFVTTGIAGVNFGYEFKKDQNLNTDYFFNHTDATTGDVYTNRTEFIGDEEIKSESRSRNENITNRHRVNFSYRDRSNKLSSLDIRGSINHTENEQNSVNTLDKYNGQDELDLQSIGGTDSKSTNGAGNVRFDYTKRFNEESKRSIRLRGRFNASSNSSTSNNNQLNKFNISDPAMEFESKQEITRDRDLDNYRLNFEAEYTEPIAGNHFIDFNARVDYEDIDDSVDQIKFENDIIQNPLIYTQYFKDTELRGRIRYKYDNEKFVFSAGASIVEQTQDFGVENGDTYKNKYTNVNPTLWMRYNPARGKFMLLNLNKSVQTPNSNQLSPVVNDFNPLFISQGNPNLETYDNYSAFAMYVSNNFATGFSFFTQLRYNYTKNSIVNSEFTNELGIRYSTYENLGDRNNFSLNFNFGNRIKKWGIRYNLSVQGSYNEYLSIINTETNETQSKDGTLGLSFENNKKDKLDATIGATWKKNYTTFSSGNNADRDYLQQSYYTKLDWNVTDRFNINSQFKYDIYTDSNFGSDQSVPIWNGSISYAMLESKSLTVMVSALDILNKNIGIERNSSDNYFEEVHKDVLGNYYMLSLTYNLNGNKNPNGNRGGGRGGFRRR